MYKLIALGAQLCKSLHQNMPKKTYFTVVVTLTATDRSWADISRIGSVEGVQGHHARVVALLAHNEGDLQHHSLMAEASSLTQLQFFAQARI